MKRTLKRGFKLRETAKKQTDESRMLHGASGGFTPAVGGSPVCGVLGGLLGPRVPWRSVPRLRRTSPVRRPPRRPFASRVESGCGAAAGAGVRLRPVSRPPRLSAARANEDSFSAVTALGQFCGATVHAARPRRRRETVQPRVFASRGVRPPSAPVSRRSVGRERGFLVRPVLKHGPRSVAGLRVDGTLQTLQGVTKVKPRRSPPAARRDPGPSGSGAPPPRSLRGVPSRGAAGGGGRAGMLKPERW